MLGIGLAAMDAAIAGHAALFAWWPQGANMALDFTGSRAMSNARPVATEDLLNCTRASNGWAKDSAGVWHEFAPNTLRITDRGLLVETGVTNYLLNSDTPATQNVSLAAGDYVLWVEGAGSAVLSGAATGTATEGSVVSFTLASTGAVTVTVSGSLDIFQLENVAQYVTSVGTSFIKTTSAPAARSTDVVNFNSVDWLDSTKGTIFLELDNVVGTNLSRAMHGSPDKFDIGVYYQSRIIWWPSDGALHAYPLGSWLRDIIKTVASYDATGRSLVVNEGVVVNGSYAVATVNSITLTLASKPLNGLVRAVTYWPERKSDAEIQGMTI